MSDRNQNDPPRKVCEDGVGKVASGSVKMDRVSLEDGKMLPTLALYDTKKVHSNLGNETVVGDHPRHRSEGSFQQDVNRNELAYIAAVVALLLGLGRSVVSNVLQI